MTTLRAPGSSTSSTTTDDDDDEDAQTPLVEDTDESSGEFNEGDADVDDETLRDLESLFALDTYLRRYLDEHPGEGFGRPSNVIRMLPEELSDEFSSWTYASDVDIYRLGLALRYQLAYIRLYAEFLYRKSDQLMAYAIVKTESPVSLVDAVDVFAEAESRKAYRITSLLKVAMPWNPLGEMFRRRSRRLLRDVVRRKGIPSYTVTVLRREGRPLLVSEPPEFYGRVIGLLGASFERRRALTPATRNAEQLTAICATRAPNRVAWVREYETTSGDDLRLLRVEDAVDDVRGDEARAIDAFMLEHVAALEDEGYDGYLPLVSPRRIVLFPQATAALRPSDFDTGEELVAQQLARRGGDRARLRRDLEDVCGGSAPAWVYADLATSDDDPFTEDAPAKRLRRALAQRRQPAHGPVMTALLARLSL